MQGAGAYHLSVGPGMQGDLSAQRVERTPGGRRGAWPAGAALGGAAIERGGAGRPQHHLHGRRYSQAMMHDQGRKQGGIKRPQELAARIIAGLPHALEWGSNASPYGRRRRSGRRPPRVSPPSRRIARLPTTPLSSREYSSRIRPSLAGWRRHIRPASPPHTPVVSGRSRRVPSGCSLRNTGSEAPTAISVTFVLRAIAGLTAVDEKLKRASAGRAETEVAHVEARGRAAGQERFT